MEDNRPLTPAKRPDALFAISYALNTRKGHELAAKIAAEVVLETLERQGFVLMRKPPLPMPGLAPVRGSNTTVDEV